MFYDLQIAITKKTRILDEEINLEEALEFILEKHFENSHFLSEKLWFKVSKSLIS